MKLVEILATDLKVWPPRVKIITQSQIDSEIYSVNDLEETDPLKPKRIRLSKMHSEGYAYPKVTKKQWEAERAKLKAPKANGDGWVRHRGGKCPVDDCVHIEYRMRNGQTLSSQAGRLLNWKHGKWASDIMAYKIHKPAEQTAPVTLPEGYGKVITATLESTSGPIEWRDRIHELDTQRAEVESVHQRQISEITQERESLVQKLAGEGLALVEVVVRPVEDMSDHRKWREGDLLTLVGGHVSDEDFTSGSQYKFLRVDEWNEIVVIDDVGDENGYGVNSGMFKWHSRPAT